MNLVLLGPQGCGKGTQAEFLVGDFNLERFEMGSYLREIAKKRHDVDEMVNARGVLVPDELTNELLKEHLDSINKYDGIVFDGFPRTLLQYRRLKAFLAEHNSKVDFVFLINISTEESIRRLSARRMDPVTGKIYNLITNPPDSSVDLNSLVHREDDKPESIKTRLEAYHSVTQSVIAEAKEDGLLYEINGENEIETIHSEIIAVIKSKQSTL